MMFRYWNFAEEWIVRRDDGGTYSVRSAADLGAAIGDARRDAGLTQQELARRVGISRPYLTQVEHGRTSRLLDLLFDLLRVVDLELVVRRRGRHDG
jgi:HTH-type transcriptional regulator / antitoxin HipB